jgi:hypothetical protein
MSWNVKAKGKKCTVDSKIRTRIAKPKIWRSKLKIWTGYCWTSLISVPNSCPSFEHFAFTKIKSILVFCYALSTSFDIVMC